MTRNQSAEPGKDFMLESLESRLLLSGSPVAGPVWPAPADLAATVEVVTVDEPINEAPVIEHTPADSWPEGEDLTIEFHATDSTAHLKSIRVYYRQVGQTDWQVDGVRYFGSGPTDVTDFVVVPGSEMVSPGLEYYIEAIDDQGLSGLWAGYDANDPYVVTVGSQTIEVDVDISVDVINLAGKGKWVTLAVELPADSGATVEDISLDSLTLNGVSAATNTKYGFVKNPVITDSDGDGLDELLVKFDRQALLATLSAGDDVQLALAGMVGDTLFEGVGTVTVIGADNESRGLRKARGHKASKPDHRIAHPDPNKIGHLRRGGRQRA